MCSLPSPPLPSPPLPTPLSPSPSPPSIHLSRNKGMRYIVGADWRDLFDVVVVDARKPAFFLNNRR